MIGVTDIASHRQSQQLAHEVVFEAGADDLALVIQVFRSNKSDHAVHQKRIKCSGYSIGPRLQRELIDSMVRLGRERAPLSGFEVHNLIAQPVHVSSIAMMFESAFARFG